jgi:hypothetical protein
LGTMSNPNFHIFTILEFAQSPFPEYESLDSRRGKNLY